MFKNFFSQEGRPFYRHGKISVVIDGSFGSTGKGLITAWLALQPKTKVHYAVTNAAPNAGHTTVLEDGTKFVCVHIPTTALLQPCTAYLDAGAVIDIDKLFEEVDRLSAISPDLASRIVIHPRAALINKDDKDLESSKYSSSTMLSSTQKGVGSAIGRKVNRSAQLAGTSDKLMQRFSVRAIDLNREMRLGAAMVLEVPQGFSLGLNSGCSYPYCTSRDVTVSQALADAGVHPSFLGDVLMSVRSYPIRVGNVKDADGADIGYSGDGYDDQREITWGSIGQTPEITTVTGRQRRIFTWSNLQYQAALSQIRPDYVFGNFVNYLRDEDAFHDWTHQMEMGEVSILGRPTAKLWGIGPSVNDVLNTEDAIGTRWPMTGRNGE